MDCIYLVTRHDLLEILVFPSYHCHGSLCLMCTFTGCSSKLVYSKSTFFSSEHIFTTISVALVNSEYSNIESAIQLQYFVRLAAETNWIEVIEKK